MAQRAGNVRVMASAMLVASATKRSRSRRRSSKRAVLNGLRAGRVRAFVEDRHSLNMSPGRSSRSTVRAARRGLEQLEPSACTTYRTDDAAPSSSTIGRRVPALNHRAAERLKIVWSQGAEELRIKRTKLANETGAASRRARPLARRFRGGRVTAKLRDYRQSLLRLDRFATVAAV